MSNKEAINYCELMKPFLKGFYENGNYEAVNNCITQILRVCENLNKIPKNHLKQLETPVLTHSLGNSKIGEDTLCISFGTGLLCPMGITGNCKNCKICYAINQNKQFFKNTVPKNLKNQRTLNKIVLGETTTHKVLFYTVYDIMASYSLPKVKNIEYIRVDVEGDIIDNKSLEVVNELIGGLKTVFNVDVAYSYTHNKKLDLSKAPQIVFNTSDFENTHTHKQCKTIFKLTGELLDKIKNEEVILCNGDCNNCAYCKNIKDTRPVYFLAHGGEFEGIHGVFNDLMESYLSYTKEQDYLIFKMELFYNSTPSMGVI